MKQGSRLTPAIARCAAIAAVAILACAMGAHAAPQPRSTAALRAALQRDLSAYIKERGAKEHLSSLSLSVSRSAGQPTMNVVAGTTQYHAGRPVTPTSLYQIGSNTKAFTAVAILQLEAQGRLSIDKPIGDYLPQYPAYAKLTLRQLLSMTGGLESYDNTPQWERLYVKNPMAYMSADRLIRLVYPAIKYRPGSKYYYSNTGYLLAQEIVAARSKSRSFDAEMARIIRSVGLNNTFYSSNFYPPAIARRVVAGYYENNDPGFGTFIGRDMSRDSLSWAQGAGAIVSNPQDLTAWSRALYQGSALLPAKQKRELLSMISLKTAKPLAAATARDPAGFGLGVAQRFDPKLGTFWFYQGETLGFRAAHLYFPNSGLVVSLFANSRPTESNSKLPSLFSTIYTTINTAGRR